MSDREKETLPEISVEPGQETDPDLRELTKDEIQSVSGGWSPGPPILDPRVL